ncbi:hypothetical protein PG984_005288 [Apiospora sp. TS-2023a]
MDKLDKKVIQHSDYKENPVQIWTKEWSKLKIAYPDSRLFAGLWELLCRSWFRRVWILQEVACAQKATVVCGIQSVSSRTFAAMPVLFDRLILTGPYNFGHAKPVLELMPGPFRRESWYSGDRKLATLLRKFKDVEATDPKDRIYALLGISSDASKPEQFLTDYYLTIADVLRNTTSFLLFGKVVLAPHSLDSMTTEYAVLKQLPRWGLAELIDILQKPGPFWAYVFDWAVGLFELTLIKGLVATGVFDASINIRECHVNPITVLAFRGMTDLQDQLLDGILDGSTYAFFDSLLVGKTLDDRTHAFLDGLSFLPGQHVPI